MRRALDEVVVTGIQTTLPFDRALIRDDGFARGEISTDWVEAHWDGEAEPARRAPASRGRPPREPSTGYMAPRPAEPAPSLRKDNGTSAWRAAGRTAATDRWPR